MMNINDINFKQMEETINYKQFFLLDLLSRENDWVDSNRILFELQISLRSLRYYVSEINKIGKIIISSKNGYTLDPIFKEDIKIMLKEHTKKENENIERRKTIEKKVLLSSKPINKMELADNLHYSLATIQSDILVIKKSLNKHNIKLLCNKNEVVIKGEEKVIRKYISSMLYEEILANFISAKTLKGIFPDTDFDELKAKVLNIIKKNGYDVSDFGLINICIHLCIMLDRNQIQTAKEEVLYKFDGIDKVYYQMTNEIFDYLRNRYPHIHLSKSETNPIAMVISINVNNRIVNELNFDKNDDSANVKLFIDELISNIKNYYLLDFNTGSLKIRLAVHLLQWLKNPNRLHKNPILTDVKNSYPLVFELAVYAASKIKEKYPQLDINDNEISYIALHLGISIEEYEDKKYRAILLVSDYYDLRESITKKIIQAFASTIEIVDSVVNVIDIDDSLNYNFIVTTNKNVDLPDTQYVTVSPFLTTKDISNVYKFLDSLKHTRGSTLSELLTRYISPNYFISTNESNLDKYQVIKKLANIFTKNGIVDENFYNGVIEREKIASTRYLNFAIPHSFVLNESRSAIGIYVFRNGLKWGENENVNIVFLITVNENQRKEFTGLIKYITHIFSSNKWLNAYRNIKTYEDFIDFLIKYDE